MSMFGTRFSSAVTALRGELSAPPQTATETITKLVEKIQTSPSVDDRRTAVLGLKGLSREYKADVGREAFPSLIAVLVHDSPHDSEIAKASLHTFMSLCEVAEKPAKDDIGLKHIDMFLETPEPFHAVLGLLSTTPDFRPRFLALQFLSQILTARAPLAQQYILSAPPPGVDSVLTVLDPKAPAPGSQGPLGGGAGEMLRNEGLLLLPVLLAGNADLQKIIAFSGAFEKVLDVIHSEDGIEGGIVVQDALTVISTLLRFNVSNQNFFRELSLMPSLPQALHFPAGLTADEAAPDDFALQDWPEQKLINAGIVVGLIRMLVGGPGGVNQTALANGGVTRCLLEVALASNSPNGLKCQALNTLTPIMLSSPANQALLSTLKISPLVTVHADDEHPNGGFIRLPPRPAVVALVSAVVEGDPSAGGRGLRGRAAGVNMFEAFVSGNDDAREGILSSLVAPPSDNPNSEYPDEPQSAGSIILSGLLDFPSSDIHLDPYRPLFSCLLMAHLLRNSERGKKLAREVSFPGGDGDTSTDEDDKVSLLQLVVGNLIMAARAQGEAANRAVKEGGIATSEEEDWTRVMVGYLVLLCTWLWDSPKSVKEFLSESANLQVLIGPITQPNGIDPLVQGLCAFLLGVCYEFNREPGEVTRATLHPILHSRIGPDQFVSRMARLREDPRFRAVQPDAFDTEGDEAIAPPLESDDDEGLELWFDWAFVDFWKNHYYTVQRSIAVDPDVVRQSSSSDDGSSAEIIMNLRQRLKASTEEVVNLHAQMTNLKSEHSKEKDHLATEIESLGQQANKTDGGELDTLRSDLAAAKAAVSSSLAESAAHAETKAQLEAATSELEELRAELTRLKEEGDEKLKAVEKGKEEAEAKLVTVEKEAKEKIEAAEKKAKEAASGGGGGKGKKGKSDGAELAKLKERVSELEKVAEEEREKAAEAEKEHEDLLVLLDELSSKRRKDKAALREKGVEVSEDEDEDDEE